MNQRSFLVDLWRPEGVTLSRSARNSGGAPLPRRPAFNGSSRLRRRHLARRFDILRAAGREFLARGFFETGMRAIAAASDLTTAKLYNYFRDKNEILLSCPNRSLAP